MSKGLYELAYGTYTSENGELYGRDGTITVEADTYKEAVNLATERLPEAKGVTRYGQPRWHFRMISCTDTSIRKVIPDQTIIDASTTLVAGKVRF